ncbi:sensor histidine kinase [Cohnella caldifontis]|uniref:sensor histidine kinase n=1 Tax=Cohnella caldifontis TaxID=3027471 RepID=UPI0023ED2B03|nr:HAMP domain-containing sensor histidine kinase [Cohnella sp. YIM B05605]
MERIAYATEEMARLWRNPSVRRLATLLFAVCAAAVLLVWGYIGYTSDRLRQDWLAQQAAILGRLAAESPEEAPRLARLLAHPERLSPEELAQGRELAAQYGLTEELEASLTPIVGKNRLRNGLLLSGGVLVVFGILALLLLREYRRELTTVRKLALSLENAVKHNVPMKFRLYGEGEIGLLANQAQELAIRLQQTIGQLRRDKLFLKDTVAEISHQLKTPLSSLAVYTDLLLEGAVEPATAREFLETCRRQLDRMEWLIQSLLKIARLEADALPLQLRPAPLGETIEQALDAIRRLAEERGVRIVLDESAAEPVSVPHDPRWLAEAIANLLKNAVEHSPAGSGSPVRIRLERTPVFLRLHVEDSGPGIDPKHLPHVFKKFFRASRSGSGVGLGLPLAKTIAERHGGMLTASLPEGGGTRFSLTLPLHPLPSPGSDETYESVSPDKGEL